MVGSQWEPTNDKARGRRVGCKLVFIARLLSGWICGRYVSFWLFTFLIVVDVIIEVGNTGFLHYKFKVKATKDTLASQGLGSIYRHKPE